MKLNFSDINVLLVGDFMLDHYIFGQSNRMSPEAPVPVVIPEKEYSVPGGAGNVALNLSKMGANIKCLGVIGNDIWGENLIKMLKEKGINTENIIINEKYPTTLKQRTYSNGNQVMRLDIEKIVQHNKLNINVNNDYNIIILSDYNKGVLNKDTIKKIIEKGSNLNIPIFVDPKKDDFSLYKGATILTPNLNELQRASKISIKDNNSIVKASIKLIEKNNFDYIVTTKGEKGITVVGKDTIKHIKSEIIQDGDVTGAGDTVIALISLVFYKTKDIELAVKIANKAGKLIVSKKGTNTISFDEIF